MLTKIQYKRIYDEKKNRKEVRILDVSGVYEREDLPAMYLEHIPRYYKKEKEKIIKVIFNRKFHIGPYVTYLEKGNVLLNELFGEIVTAMKEAGEDLTKIRKEVRKEKAEWEDNKVHEIVI
ncbi:MAG: hypothetical protein J7K62_01950 [Thermoplasmata archaeon]|nr:hypothetical protein [Thermoplasmata archaeon]